MSAAKHFPEWEKMTVREVRDYLQRRQSVILPLGIIEQHGYHLPLSTDTLIAREIAKRIGVETDILVAPTIHMSFSGGQLPGTINVNPNVMGLLVGDVLRSLTVQGFRNIFMLLAHGGSENFRALDTTVKLLLRDDPTFAGAMLVLAPVWKFSPVWDEGFSDGDWHAGWVETSLVMELAPDLVQMDRLELDSTELVESMRKHPDNYQYACKPVDREYVIPRLAQRPEIRVGVMGDPAKASRELGHKVVEDVVTNLSKLLVELEAERADEYRKVDWTPEPIIL